MAFQKDAIYCFTVWVFTHWIIFSQKLQYFWKLGRYLNSFDKNILMFFWKIKKLIVLYFLIWSRPLCIVLTIDSRCLQRLQRWNLLCNATPCIPKNSFMICSPSSQHWNEWKNRYASHNSKNFPNLNFPLEFPALLKRELATIP